jgi:hypothetical protein
MKKIIAGLKGLACRLGAHPWRYDAKEESRHCPFCGSEQYRFDEIEYRRGYDAWHQPIRYRVIQSHWEPAQ